MSIFIAMFSFLFSINSQFVKKKYEVTLKKIDGVLFDFLYRFYVLLIIFK